MRIERSLCCILAAALAFALCGCERDHVEVTIEPRPDGSFVRTIRLWHTDPKKKGQILAPPKELVEHVQRHYAKRLDAAGEAVRFQGDLTRQLSAIRVAKPADETKPEKGARLILEALEAKKEGGSKVE